MAWRQTQNTVRGAPSLEWQSYLHFFMGILVLFGTKFQYSNKMRQDDEGKQSGKAAI